MGSTKLLHWHHSIFLLLASLMVLTVLAGTAAIQGDSSFRTAQWVDTGDAPMVRVQHYTTR